MPPTELPKPKEALFSLPPSDITNSRYGFRNNHYSTPPTTIFRCSRLSTLTPLNLFLTVKPLHDGDFHLTFLCQPATKAHLKVSLFRLVEATDIQWECTYLSLTY